MTDPRPIHQPAWKPDGRRREYELRDPTPPEQTPVLERTPRVTNDFGTEGVQGPPKFPDTFQGPKNKKYLDFLCRQTTRIRGVNVYYYVMQSQTRRIDGDRPLDDPPTANEFSRSGRTGGHARDDRAKGIAAFYGEPVIVGQRKSSIAREVMPDWSFDEPILVRGIVQDPTRSEEPDERGSIYVRGARLGLARILCEEEWGITPQIGDVVRLPDLLEGYYDVEEVMRNDSRFGASGFFTEFGLRLAKSSRYTPERKLADKDIRPQPDPVV